MVLASCRSTGWLSAADTLNIDDNSTDDLISAQKHVNIPKVDRTLKNSTKNFKLSKSLSNHGRVNIIPLSSSGIQRFFHSTPRKVDTSVDVASAIVDSVDLAISNSEPSSPTGSQPPQTFYNSPRTKTRSLLNTSSQCHSKDKLIQARDQLVRSRTTPSLQGGEDREQGIVADNGSIAELSHISPLRLCDSANRLGQNTEPESVKISKSLPLTAKPRPRSISLPSQKDVHVPHIDRVVVVKRRGSTPLRIQTGRQAVAQKSLSAISQQNVLPKQQLPVEAVDFSDIQPAMLSQTNSTGCDSPRRRTSLVLKSLVPKWMKCKSRDQETSTFNNDDQSGASVSVDSRVKSINRTSSDSNVCLRRQMALLDTTPSHDEDDNKSQLTRKNAFIGSMVQVSTRRTVTFTREDKLFPVESGDEYDRTPITQAALSDPKQVFHELIVFKLTEMVVHEDSCNNTNLHTKNLEGEALERRMEIVRDILLNC